jgi:hypothetical protein
MDWLWAGFEPVNPGRRGFPLQALKSKMSASKHHKIGEKQQDI